MIDGTFVIFHNQEFWLFMSNAEDLWLTVILNLAEAWIRIAGAIKLVRGASCLASESLTILVRCRLSCYNRGEQIFRFFFKETVSRWAIQANNEALFHMAIQGPRFPLLSPSPPRLEYYCCQHGQSWVTISPGLQVSEQGRQGEKEGREQGRGLPMTPLSDLQVAHLTSRARTQAHGHS